MSITENDIVGEVVAKDYRTASIFNKSGIDFCCRGNRSIAEACEKNGIGIDQLTNTLNLVINQKERKIINYNQWPIDLLADHIENKHHKYVEEKIVEIKPFISKIAKVHGDKHPELFEIESLFIASAGELTKHMKKEELILFPFIKKMVRAEESGEQLRSPQFAKIENPLEMLKAEHKNEGDRLQKIAELSKNYQPPSDACGTYIVTMALLQEFEDDLHLHIHLENNILFPKALKLEKDLRNKNRII